MRSKRLLFRPCADAADARARQRIASIEARLRAKLTGEATLTEQIEALLEVTEDDE